MTLYIWRNTITLDKGLLNDYMLESYIDDYSLRRVEDKIASEWIDNVDLVENITLEQVMEYIEECYRMLEYKWLWKE